MVPENLMRLGVRPVQLSAFRGWQDVIVAALRHRDAWAGQGARMGNGI